MNNEENKREPDETPPEDREDVRPEPTEQPLEEEIAGTPDFDDELTIEDPAELEADDEEVAEPGGDREAELEAALEQTIGERDEYYDSMLRMKAEFDNSKKRLERERERILHSASERVLVSLLPVLDNLDRALQSEGDVREGVRATRDQLFEVLGNEGLTTVVSDGEHFDPNVHEAVMSQPSEEHEEGVVLQTFERGYLLNGKPVRVAKVVVAQ